MSFWNKKHNHFQNSKHMPAYTMQSYTWAYKLNTKYPRIHCGCICGIQSNRQIPAYTIWLYKRPTNKSSNSRVYNVVVNAAHKQLPKFLRIQYGCISGLPTNHQISMYTMWLYMWLISSCQIPTYAIWLYKRQTNKIPNFHIYNVAVYAAYKWLPNSHVYITTV